jgi:hypothetical protein
MKLLIKNQTRVIRRVDQVIAAWEQIAPTAEFAGMNLAAFRTAVKPSMDTRERLTELETTLRGTLAERAAADAATRDRLILVVNSVRGHPNHGENSALYRAMGYVPADEKRSGLTRRKAVTSPSNN